MYMIVYVGSTFELGQLGFAGYIFSWMAQILHQHPLDVQQIQERHIQ